jgi:hypothetical protein
MTISFKRPDYNFWATATSHELYMLDLQELFNHVFQAKQETTMEFLKWLPTSFHMGASLSEQAASKLAMLQAPITYSNEDCDRRQCISAWAMNSVPAAAWMNFRNEEAWNRLETERKAKPMAA